jgi:TonB family protein
VRGLLLLVYCLNLYFLSTFSAKAADQTGSGSAIDVLITTGQTEEARSLASNTLDQLYRNKATEAEIDAFLIAYHRYIDPKEVRRVLVMAISRSKSNHGKYTIDAVPLLIRLGLLDSLQRRLSFKRAIKATTDAYGKNSTELATVLHQIVTDYPLNRKIFKHVRRAQLLLQNLETPRAQRMLADVNFTAGINRLYFGSERAALEDLQLAADYYLQTPEIEKQEVRALALTAIAFERTGDQIRAQQHMLAAARKRAAAGETDFVPLLKPRLVYDSVGAVPSASKGLGAVGTGGVGATRGFSDGGLIRYRITVDERGRVIDATIVKQTAYGRHQSAAQTAVTELRFIPQFRDGELVKTEGLEFTFRFNSKL